MTENLYLNVGSTTQINYQTEYFENDSKESEIKETVRKGTFFSSFFNLTNTTVGGGTLTLPLAIRQCGLGLGLLLFFLVGALAFYTFHCVLKGCEDNKKLTNQEIYQESFGRFSYILDVFYFSLCFGGICMYLNIIGTSMSLQFHQWFGNIAIADKYVISAIVLCLILIPLCLLKDISYLGYTSSFSIFSILFVDFVIIIKFIEKMTTTGINTNNLVFFNVGSFENVTMIFSVIGSFFFSFISQYNIIPIYKELKNRSKIKMIGIISSSILTSGVIYLLSAVLGYFIFLDTDMNLLKGNVLDNFSQTDILASISKFLVIIVIILSYPVIHFTARGSLMNVIPATEFSSEIITLVLCGSSFIIGLGIPDVMLLMNLSVSVSGLLGCFCFPILLHFLKFKSWWTRIPNLMLMLIVIGISIFSFTQSLLELIQYIWK
eukprot:gene10989-3695_t